MITHNVFILYVYITI